MVGFQLPWWYFKSIPKQRNLLGDCIVVSFFGWDVCVCVSNRRRRLCSLPNFENSNPVHTGPSGSTPTTCCDWRKNGYSWKGRQSQMCGVAPLASIVKTQDTLPTCQVHAFSCSFQHILCPLEQILVLWIWSRSLLNNANRGILLCWIVFWVQS